MEPPIQILAEYRMPAYDVLEVTLGFSSPVLSIAEVDNPPKQYTMLEPIPFRINIVMRETSTGRVISRSVVGSFQGLTVESEIEKSVPYHGGLV